LRRNENYLDAKERKGAQSKIRRRAASKLKAALSDAAFCKQIARQSCQCFQECIVISSAGSFTTAGGEEENCMVSRGKKGQKPIIEGRGNGRMACGGRRGAWLPAEGGRVVAAGQMKRYRLVGEPSDGSAGALAMGVEPFSLETRRSLMESQSLKRPKGSPCHLRPAWSTKGSKGGISISFFKTNTRLGIGGGGPGSAAVAKRLLLHVGPAKGEGRGH